MYMIVYIYIYIHIQQSIVTVANSKQVYCILKSWLTSMNISC